MWALAYKSGVQFFLQNFFYPAKRGSQSWMGSSEEVKQFFTVFMHI